MLELFRLGPEAALDCSRSEGRSCFLQGVTERTQLPLKETWKPKLEIEEPGGAYATLRISDYTSSFK